MAFTDKTLTCVDCGAAFTFSARDQEFHAEKGFANEPKRCFACRQARRASRGDAPASRGEAPATRTAAPASGGARPQRQPVYGGPRAQASSRPPRGREGGRPRGRRDSDRRGGFEDGGSGYAQRSFDGGAGAPAAYTGSCAVCGNDTPVSAQAGGLILCPECYSKMTAIARS